MAGNQALVGTLVTFLVLTIIGVAIWSKVSHQTVPELIKGIIEAIKSRNE